MNIAAIEKIANAVLYEGYVLYPYRPSALKNQQRFNFGVLYPPSYSDLQLGSDASDMQTECLVLGDVSTTVESKVRFLQMASREQWQEGHEREICLPACELHAICAQPHLQRFSLREALEGEVEFRAEQIDGRLFKLTLNIRNLTALENPSEQSRDQVLLRSFVSVHSILKANAGEFVSLMDPAPQYKQAAQACCNRGTWPVLAGDERQHDLILSAPIILYDYPEIAPESPGDLCDSCEIEEILALRILTMTDAEKAEVRNGDDRARLILERTELMPPEHFQKLHSALRGVRTSHREEAE